jgi:hypothetical protein
VITLQDVFEFKLDEAAAGRSIVGRLRYTGLRPTFVSKFERRGVQLPPRMSGSETAPPTAPRRLALR